VNQRLKSVDVKLLSGQTQFVNTQLAQRAFSWSELLDRLEGVLADDVRLTSIAPTFRPDGTVFLSLALEAKSADGLVDLLKRFNRDPQFANPFPSNESQIPGGGYHITLTVEFKPQLVKTTAVQR
jgi:hypothetical protein